MTTKVQTIVEDPSLMDAVKKLDQELGELVDQLRETNERMAAENERLRRRLGLPPREAVCNG